MSALSIFFWTIYFLITGLHLFFIQKQDLTFINHTIISAMPILMIIVFLQTKLKTSMSRMLMGGVFLGWLGDVFLMDDIVNYFGWGDRPFLLHISQHFFLIGLVAFLLGHLYYIYIFSKEVSSHQRSHYIMEKPYWIIPFFAFLVFVIWLLSDREGSLPLPAVYVYALIICLMSVMAINRRHAASTSSWIIVIVGSLLFIVSDFSLSIKLFFGLFPGANFIIKSSYLLAQGAIVYGCLSQPLFYEEKSMK